MSTPLFDALDEIAPRLESASRRLLCTDFDGTLVDYADDRSAVQLPEDLRRDLAQLASRPATTVAIFSGRAEADLRERLAGLPVVLAPNHGLELHGPDWFHIEPEVQEARPMMAQLAGQLEQAVAAIAGTEIENKGLSIAVHERRVAPEDREAVRAAVHNVLAAAGHPFYLTHGTLVHDIRPRVYWDKAAAIRRIVAQGGEADTLVIYVAGDAAAEEAFLAIADGLSIRVGPAGESAAKYTVEGPADAQRFIAWLARPTASRGSRG